MTKRKAALTRTRTAPPCPPASGGEEDTAGAVNVEQIVQAVRELGIDVPVYRWRVVGNRLELHAYGGVVYLWPDRKGEAIPNDRDCLAPTRREGQHE